MIFLGRIRNVPAAFALAASGNITASGEATTAQLTAPSGKTSGADFQTGRMWDDENGADTLDLASGKYTELEWCIKAANTVIASTVYEFRLVSVYETPLETYSVTPQWTIGGGTQSQAPRSLHQYRLRRV